MDPVQRGAGRYIQTGLGIGAVRVQVQAGEGQFDGGRIAKTGGNSGLVIRS